VLEHSINSDYLGSFVNFSFAINTLAAIYKRLFLLFKTFYIRAIPTIAYTLEGEDHRYTGLTKLARKLNENLSKNHQRIQKFLYNFSRTFALIGAIFCFVTHISLILGLGNFLGKNIVLLASPIIFYLILSLSIFLLFVLPLLFINGFYVLVTQQIKNIPRDFDKTNVPSDPTK